MFELVTIKQKSSVSEDEVQMEKIKIRYCAS